MSYRDILVNLGDTTEAKVLKVYALMDAGKLTYIEAVGVMSTLIGKAQARAVALAETSLAAELTLRTLTPVAVVATSVAPNMTKVRGAVRVVLATTASTPDPAGRIARMVRGITYKAASDAYSEGISKSALVEGWSRGLEPDACQMCRWWWREGRVWPSSHVMPAHSGCTCFPVPELAARVIPVSRNAMNRSGRDRERLNQQSEVASDE